ncbi:Ig-like domain-containing protein, partial [Cellvibrio polysaccharolyticus]
MKDIAIVSKAGGHSNNLPWGDVPVSSSSSVIKIPVSPNDIRLMERSGQNLVITTKTGETITLQGYFNATGDGGNHDIVFEDSNGKLWQAEYSSSTSSYAYKEIASISELLLISGNEASGAGWLWPLLGAAGVGVAISESSGGDGFVRLNKPLAPTNIAINDDGTAIVGRGEAGTTVIVRGANGNVIGQGTVGANGEFQVVLQPPQNNGETITVIIRDSAGQESDPVTITAPTGESEEQPGEEEQTAPDAPTQLAINDSGTTLTGLGEPDTLVQVRDAAGNVIGTGTVAADGTFTVTLQPPQTNGQTLSVTLTNSDNQTSPVATISAPIINDSDAPDAPTDLSVNANGTTLTGRGEPGTQVQVRDPAGNLIGTGAVVADGSFTVSLQPPQTDGQTLSVTLTNSNDQTSPAATVSAPSVDDEAPDAPTNLAVNASGNTLTGLGEPGTAVQVRGPNGNIIGTGTVAANGTFSVALLPPQSNGQLLSVTLTDSSNQTSLPATVNAPIVDNGGGDLAPNPPTNLAVSGDGTSLSGRGQPGTQVQVRNADGDLIGSGSVQNNGTFTVSLLPPQTEGQLLSVTLTNSLNLTSSAATVNAPDVDNGGGDVPDAATNLVVSPDGSSVSGNGEAGASVTITDPDGNEIGSGTVQPDGSFTVAIAPPQINGETLTVVLGNANGDSDPATVVAPNVDAGDDVPAPATGLVVSPDGSSVSGNGEAGASVTITDPDGNDIGSGTVQPDGSFTVAIAPPQINGETLTVVLGNANGDSDPATVVAPNVDAGDDVPAPATGLVVSPDGSSVSGNGEAGATVTITDPDGNEIGSGTVQPDGSFTVAIAPPQINGETLTVVLGNANGDSDPATVVAPNVDAGDDVPAPATGLVVSPDGSSVSGNGEAGASVTITDPDGNEIGSGTVQPDGSFTVAIAPPQINGETLTVVLGNANGDSDPATVVAPNVDAGDDVPAPATGLVVSPDGSSVSGNGEAGASVTITDPDGNEIGSGTVQ